MKKNTVLVFLGFIIISGVSFFAGMKYQESKRTSSFRQFSRGQEAGMGFGQSQGNRTGFRPVNGEIMNIDDKSMTVKLQDGSSKIIFFSDKTTINKAANATKNDLKTGEKVAVFGQENSDGSVTAQNIQLNPIFRNVTGIAPK